MTGRNVVVDIKARTTQYQRAVRSATKSTKGLSLSLSGVGKVALGGAALGVAAIGAAAVKVGIDSAKAFGAFETSLSRIEGLVGIAGDEVDRMASGIKELSVETARGPQELAEALFFITSAGLEGADAMDALKVSAKAATAGLGDSAVVADVVTSAMNAYGEGIDGAGEATDVLVASVREGKAEAPALASSLGRVIPIASQMGVTFDQVGAAIAAMTRVGLDANEASTALRSIMNSLLAPTTDAAKALEEVGLSAAGLRRQIKDEGLFSTLQTLTESFQGNDEAVTRVFGNVRALTGVMSLMGSNAEATEDIFNSLADSTGSLDSAFGAAAETGAFSFEQAKTRIEVALLDVGEKILPKLADAVDQIAPSIPGLVEGFGDLAIVMADLGTAIIPTFAAGLENLPQTVRGIQIVFGDFRRELEGFANVVDVITGPWYNLEDAWSQADENGQKFLKIQAAIFNEMQGAAKPINIAVTAMAEMSESGIVQESRLASMQAQLGLTNDEWARAAQHVIDNGAAYGLTAGELRPLVSLTREARTASEEAAAARAHENEVNKFLALSTQDTADATENATEATVTLISPTNDVADALAAAAAESRSLADAMLEMSNPTFKAVKAVEKLKAAQEKVVETSEDSEASAQDIAAAQLEVVKATLEAQGALDALAVDPTNLQASIEAIQLVLGGTREDAFELLETLGILDGKQIEALVTVRGEVVGDERAFLGNTGLSIAGPKALGGPVRKGLAYKVGERGEELFVPDRNGSIIPNSVLNQNDQSSNVNLTIVGSDNPAQDAESLLLLASVAGN